jgi:hypothetical protein
VVFEQAVEQVRRFPQRAEYDDAMKPVELVADEVIIGDAPLAGEILAVEPAVVALLLLIFA